MKKIFTLAAAMLCMIAATATEYTGQLTVSVTTEEGTQRVQQETTITLNETNGTYEFSLKNFALSAGEETMGVGNIVLPNLTASEAAGFKNIAFNGGTPITEGDDPNVDMWFGPMLGEVPLDMFTTFTDAVLSVHINIDMTAVIGQVIEVSFTGINAEAMGGDTSELEAQISTLQGQLEEANGSIESQKTELDEANGKVETLQGQLEEANGTIESLREQIEGYVSAIKGDVDGDGVVNANDIAAVVNIIAGITPAE